MSPNFGFFLYLKASELLNISVCDENPCFSPSRSGGGGGRGGGWFLPFSSFSMKFCLSKYFAYQEVEKGFVLGIYIQTRHRYANVRPVLIETPRLFWLRQNIAIFQYLTQIGQDPLSLAVENWNSAKLAKRKVSLCNNLQILYMLVIYLL